MAKRKTPKTSETGGRASPMAVRARLIREVCGMPNESASAFARRLGFTENQWINIENGYPISREVAVRLAQSIPGLSIDWLYLGTTAGLSLDMARRLNLASGSGIKGQNGN